jgi:microcystin-dependent protein
MKPSSILKLTALVILISFSKATFAQITSTGMAIQGIARDASNNAITNAAIGIKFTPHYTNSSNANVDLPSVTVSLTTDAFGVFSYVLDMSSIETSLFFDNQMKLKIEQTSPATNLISDENLNFVPYAVSASNGVPTGTIMPYVGTTAPRGWALCDGSAIPITPLTLTLRTLLGSNNTPDLRGMFLRGAGTNSNNAYAANVGPNLRAIQTDDFKSHFHAVNLTTSQNGEHNHSKTTNNQASDDGDGAIAWNNTDGEDLNNSTVYTDNAGAHTHSVSGNTASTGVSETRPINYGVTYIIKL